MNDRRTASLAARRRKNDHAVSFAAGFRPDGAGEHQAPADLSNAMDDDFL
jgi:hypothetical protein